MTTIAWTFLAAWLVTTVLFIIVQRENMDVAKRNRELRSESAKERTWINMLLAEPSDAGQDIQRNDLLHIDQARKSLAQQARIAELEADVSVSRAAAHGSAWGPTL